MIHPLMRKIVAITPPGAIIDNASATTTEIDTQGYDYLVVNVLLGALDIAMSALKLQSGDVSGTLSDVTGLIYGTSVNDLGSASTLPSAAADNTFVSFFVDLRGHKRYFDLVATLGDGVAGTYISAWAELWRAKDGPRTAAEAGYGQRIIA